MGTLLVANHAAHRIVHAHLIIQVVESGTQVVAILAGVIHLADKHALGIAVLHLIRGPMPEGSRHHLGHVATESVNALSRPEEQYLSHLIPCVGDRIKVAHAAGIVIHAVVQLHRLVPVVHARCIVETVVTRGLGRLLVILLSLTVIQVEVRMETLSGTIIEVVLRVESVLWVILLTQILYPFGLADRVILTSHVVGYKVDNHLQSGLVCALYQRLKLLHALLYVLGQIRVDIIVVGNGVRRTSLTFHHRSVLTWNAVLGVIGLRCMSDNTCVPNMAHAHLLDSFQGFGREVVQFSATVLSDRAIFHSVGAAIAIKPRKNLINYHLIRCHGLQPLC